MLTEIILDDADFNISERRSGRSGKMGFAREVLPKDAPENALITGMCETREIGYTTLQNGVMESFNLRNADSTRRNWVGFGFGDTQVMPASEIMTRIMAEGQKASFYVGHSLGVDLDHMREHGAKMPSRPILDTFLLAKLVGGLPRDLSGVSVSVLAKHFGIAAPKPHSGGNDARYTMEVLLAMMDAYA